MNRGAGHVLLALLAICWSAGCQLHSRTAEIVADMPAAPLPAPLPYTVSAMHLQTVRPTLFAYIGARSSFNDLASTATRTVGDLQRVLSARRIHSAEPLLFIYHDPSENPAKAFDLEIGVSLPDGTTIPAALQSRKLPAFHCATLLYRGPMRLLNKAYEKLLPQMISAGLVPSEQTRESYITWESPTSKNNVVQIQVGIQ